MAAQYTTNLTNCSIKETKNSAKPLLSLRVPVRILAPTFAKSVDKMKVIAQSLSTFFIIVLALLAFNPAHASSPKDTITTAAGGVIDSLNSLSKEQRTPEVVRSLVIEWLIPAIDVQRVAMGVLGKHWRSASAEQRQAFTQLFRDQQIRTYTGAFQSFNGEKMVIDAPRFNDKKDRAIVKSALLMTDGSQVGIEFRLYDNKGQWLIYDAVVEGLSMVKTYRDQTSEKLQNMSIDALLAELSQTSKDQ